MVASAQEWELGNDTDCIEFISKWNLVRRLPVDRSDFPTHPSIMRISPKPANACPWYLWPFFWNQRRKYGAVLDSALLWARAPKVFLGVAFLYGMIDRKNSPLNPGLRSLVTVRVSQLNGCRFCVDLNSATLLKRGVPASKVEALDAWQQSALFSDPERVALEYAEAVTLRSDAIDEHLTDRLKRHFDDNAIIELTALIAFQIYRVSSTALWEFRRKDSARFRAGRDKASVD